MSVPVPGDEADDVRGDIVDAVGGGAVSDDDRACDAFRRRASGTVQKSRRAERRVGDEGAQHIEPGQRRRWRLGEAVQ
ncbi:hypothetical protein ACIO8G_03205 [Streptomyces sp. NPDC087219]|uniref:hypothetical protein n=1 Tax=Streptomyces sp. NPDC087219 TaxID=3365770 RepID=UPI00380243D7